MKAVLHIGTEKTGSTSIQRLLRRNRAALRDRGYLTAPSLGGGSQIGLGVVALADAPLRKVHRKLGLSSAEEVAEYRRRLSRRLRSLTKEESATLLLTCEQLSFLVDDEGKVQRLVSWLAECDVEVSVLVYLRRQDGLLASSYQQEVKSGYRAPFRVPPEDIAGETSKYDYWSMLQRWASVLGPERVTPRIFDRESLVGGDVVIDYLEQVGIHDRDGLEMPDVYNPSMSADAVEFLRLMNHYLPDRSSGPNSERGNVSYLLRENAHDGPPLRLDPEDARRFLDRFQSGNRRVASEFFGRDDEVLFPDPAEHPREEDPHPLTLERAAELAARLWLAKQAEVSELRRHVKLGEAHTEGTADYSSDEGSEVAD